MQHPRFSCFLAASAICALAGSVKLVFAQEAGDAGPGAPTPPDANASSAPAASPSTAPAPSASPEVPAAAPPAPTPGASLPPSASATTPPTTNEQNQEHGASTWTSSARVHLFVDYPAAWLELRSTVDREHWRRVCAAPCDQTLLVEGREARIRAPRMTTSNVFRIEPGLGTAGLRVSGGSASAQRIGLVGLIAGIPIALGGMATFGYASVSDKSELRTAGIVSLAVGAAAVLASIPLLMVGSTTVRDSKGKVIARRADGQRAF